MKYLFTILVLSFFYISISAQTADFEVFERNDSTFVVSEGLESYIDVADLDQRIQQTSKAEQSLQEENQLLLNIVQNKRNVNKLSAERQALQAVRKKVTQLQSEE